MRLSAGLVLVATLAFAQCALADAENADAKVQQAVANQTKSDDNEVVCKKEKIIGSMIPKKTCTTKRELREIREASQDALQEIQRNTTSSGGGLGEG